MTGLIVDGLPRPAALTIDGVADGFGSYTISITVAPSWPDPGGTFTLYVDHGMGWELYTSASTDDFGAIPAEMAAGVSDPGSPFMAIETGGGVTNAGDSPPSNVWTNPL